MITIAELLQEKEKIKNAEKKYKEQKPKTKTYIKDYLSQHDREEIIVLAAIISKLEELLCLYYEHHRGKGRIKNIKTAITFLYKVLDDYFIGMSDLEKQREVAKIIKELKYYHIEIKKGCSTAKI